MSVISHLERVALIVSPPCSRKQGGVPFRRYMEPLLAAVPHISVHETQRQGHATEIASRCLDEGVQTIITAGGDGTISEVVNGMVGRQALLGLIPLGRGNDYYRSLLWESHQKLDTSPLAVVQRIVDGHSIAVDVGLSTFVDFAGQPVRRHYVVGATLGFSAAVTLSVERTRWAGAASYLLCLFTNLLVLQKQSLRLTMDGESRHSGTCFNLNLAMARFYGTGMVSAPRAVVTDGQLDVVWMGDFSRLDVLRYLPNNYSGDFDPVPKVEQWTASRVAVAADHPAVIQMDGDCVGTTPLEIEVLPKALQLLI